MHHNCTTDFEVRACTVSSPHVRKKNSFHKLSCVIRIFIRKIFKVQYQCHPRNIFNIELFPNYGMYQTYVLHTQLLFQFSVNIIHSSRLLLACIQYVHYCLYHTSHLYVIYLQCCCTMCQCRLYVVFSLHALFMHLIFMYMQEWAYN